MQTSLKYLPTFMHSNLNNTFLSITAIWCTNRKSNVRRCGSGLYVGINFESLQQNFSPAWSGRIFFEFAQLPCCCMLNPASCNACTHHVSIFYCHVSTAIPSCRYHKFSSVCEHLTQEFNCTYQYNYANTSPGTINLLPSM